MLRPSDHIARIDQDRFLVLLPDTRMAEGTQVGEKLRCVVGNSPLALLPQPLSVDMGVAVMQVQRETCSIGEILERAHSSLRCESSEVVTSKKSSTNTITIPDLVDLNSTVNHGRFRAVSQPILELQKEEVLGYELLSRGPVGGSLEMAVDFFRIALEANMLTTIDLSCLKACVEVSKRLHPKGKFHLNLFPSTILGTPSERLMDLLTVTEEGVTFCIEISEQQFIGDPACLREHVAAFKEKGIEVSIDDVGLGRSRLKTLIMLEPDVVKIDRSIRRRSVEGSPQGPPVEPACGSFQNARRGDRCRRNRIPGRSGSAQRLRCQVRSGLAVVQAGSFLYTPAGSVVVGRSPYRRTLVAQLPSRATVFGSSSKSSSIPIVIFGMMAGRMNEGSSA